MNWPFVSRALLEEARRRLSDEQARHELTMAAIRADLAAERDRYGDLLAQFVTLRVAGATVGPTPNAPEPAPIAAPKVDELRDLIHAKFPGNSRQRGMAIRQLAVDRASGVSDENIREAIEHGVESAGVPA